MLIDGKQISKNIKDEVFNVVKERNLDLTLLVILVGNDPASEVYVKNKEKACKNAGIKSETIRMSADSKEEDIIKIIRKANKNKHIDGILVQLPLPKGLNEAKVINEIDPLKDVDGLTLINQGKLFCNEDGVVPCTPKGIIKLLESTNLDLTGKNAVVVGRSKLVGKPVASLLLAKNCTVTQAHSRTKNLDEVCKNADVLVVAIGKDRMIKENFVKEGAIVIDVGINRVEDKLYGDVDFEAVKDKASFITPVPGGVGPMTIACLMENVVVCHDLRVKK